MKSCVVILLSRAVERQPQLSTSCVLCAGTTVAAVLYQVRRDVETRFSVVSALKRDRSHLSVATALNWDELVSSVKRFGPRSSGPSHSKVPQGPPVYQVYV